MAIASAYMSRSPVTADTSWQTDEAAQWLKRYGQHLGRLYEPSPSLPPDLDDLVSAIAAEAEADDWPDIY
jgi:hypothetical protein